MRRVVKGGLHVHARGHCQDIAIRALLLLLYVLYMQSVVDPRPV